MEPVLLLTTDQSTPGPDVTLDVEVTGYQFPQLTPSGRRDWDANWLVVRGRVRLADGRSWTFDQPSLTTWEAVELADWLDPAGSRTASSNAAPSLPTPALTAPSLTAEATLTFTEPDLVLRRHSTGPEAIVLEVELSHGALPAAQRSAGCVLRWVLTPTDVRVAAAVWREGLARFPER